MRARSISIALRGGLLGLAAAKVARAAFAAPPLGASSGESSVNSITVIIPARDEATRIGPLLAAVVGAPGVREVIVVDDQSSDGTAALAYGAGARVIAGSPLPPGWAGKAWALQQGIAAAITDWIVTLDADTRPDPRLMQRLIARMADDGVDFATVGGKFECPTVGAAWLHPAMLTTLVYRFGPPGTERRPDRMMANGQCMAFRHGTVDMAAVADLTVEDIALARHLAGSGVPVTMYDGASLLTTRMYEDLGDTWRGWSRSLALPGVEPRPRQLLQAAVLVTAMALPLPRLLTRRADIVDIVALMMRAGTLVGTRRSYRGAGAAYWLSPLADVVAVAALVPGIVSRRQRWRGRTYPSAGPPSPRRVT